MARVEAGNFTKLMKKAQLHSLLIKKHVGILTVK